MFLRDIESGKSGIVKMDELYILTNSPGEVSGWVRPVVMELGSKGFPAKISLVVLPCQYASGMEAEYGKEIEGIDSVCTFKELWKNSGLMKGTKRLVLQLGGDPFFGAILSAKLRCIWMIYTARPRWKSRVAHYFVPDAYAEKRFAVRGVERDRVTRVGNLIFDSTPRCENTDEARRIMALSEGEEAVSFLPGSRPFEYRDGFPFFTFAAMEVLRKHPNYHAFLPVAPTVDENLLTEGLHEAGLNWTGGSYAEEILWDGPGRIRFIRDNNFEAIKASALAVAFPGTNNLQITSLCVPLLTVIPLNQAENIPLDGIPGMIPMYLPGAARLKKKLVYWYSGRLKYASLPNRMAGKEIVPEHRGVMTPLMVADLVEKLISDPERLSQIVEGYSEIALERGAALKIAVKVCDYFSSVS
jgi:lipid-A-disaccharide synthase